jgi:hypothetical protein
VSPDPVQESLHSPQKEKQGNISGFEKLIILCYGQKASGAWQYITEIYENFTAFIDHKITTLTNKTRAVATMNEMKE